MSGKTNDFEVKLKTTNKSLSFIFVILSMQYLVTLYSFILISLSGIGQNSGEKQMDLTEFVIHLPILSSSELEKQLKEVDELSIDIDFLLSMNLEQLSIKQSFEILNSLEQIERDANLFSNSNILLQASRAILQKNILDYERYLNYASELFQLYQSHIKFDTTFAAVIYIDALLLSKKYAKINNLEQLGFLNQKYKSQVLPRFVKSLFYEEKYAEIRNLSSDIKTQKNPNATFYLAQSFDGVSQDSTRHFAELYARNFKYEDNLLKVKSTNGAYEVASPKNLIYIGDLFFQIEEKSACKYYQLAKLNANSTALTNKIKSIKKLSNSDSHIESLNSKLKVVEIENMELVLELTQKLEKCE